MRMCVFTGLIAAALLCGCGQTGPLYLPDEGVTTPVEVRSPTTPVPPAEPDEEKKKDEPVEVKDRYGDPPQRG